VLSVSDQAWPSLKEPLLKFISFIFHYKLSVYLSTSSLWLYPQYSIEKVCHFSNHCNKLLVKKEKPLVLLLLFLPLVHDGDTYFYTECSLLFGLHCFLCKNHPQCIQSCWSGGKVKIHWWDIIRHHMIRALNIFTWNFCQIFPMKTNWWKYMVLTLWIDNEGSPWEAEKVFFLTDNNLAGIVLKDLEEEHLVEYTSRRAR